jgi:hypothetical protein
MTGFEFILYAGIFLIVFGILNYHDPNSPDQGEDATLM